MSLTTQQQTIYPFQTGQQYDGAEILAFLAQHNAVTTKPKRKPSAYNRFMADADLRASLKETNPDYSPKEMMSALAKKWKTLSTDAKAAYQPAISPTASTPPKKKRQPSAYNRFMADKERRETIKNAHPESSPREIMSLMAAQWKLLSDDDKIPYQPPSATLALSLIHI